MRPIATPFQCVLVANRGEIAMRVIRSARALGYGTVAVYSTADANSPHVLAADRAVCIGHPQPADSYLRIPAIVEAARTSGADAVHPGYGFLAENAGFAAACREAGLVFIGPSPEAIRAMGDKAGAKRLMTAAGVPCIPGYSGTDQKVERLADEAARLGFPVMIKATAGGGGRGMRVVHEAADFLLHLRSAQSEAQHAFGDATVILERAILEPRHIEIQIFADRDGNVVHLGERDCSVQRRHQKLIEEAPSPAVDPELRARMGATAVNAARVIGYEGAGTVEFLLDGAGRHYFMEMNTRLQVEHPVTEAITGLDLVELQLRVASGEPLPLAQDQIRFHGHAIEVRLCAEDVPAGFLPQSGTLRAWQRARGIRVEDALTAGAEVPPYYDSMIAKLVGHGRTREEARRKLLQGLLETVALGVRTNQAFLARCLAHPTFIAGGATTAFIGEHASQLLQPDVAAVERAVRVAAWLLQHTAGSCSRSGQALVHGLPITLRFALDGCDELVRITQRSGSQFVLHRGEHEESLESVDAGDDEARFVLGGVLDRVQYVRDGERLWFHLCGRSFEVVDRTRSVARRLNAPSDGKLRASMNGRVVALLAAAGDRVSAGQPLVVLEAMKMEHVHLAPAAGLVEALHVSQGEQVQAQRLLAELQTEPAEVPR